MLILCQRDRLRGAWRHVSRAQREEIHPGRADDRVLPSPRCRVSLGVV